MITGAKIAKKAADDRARPEENAIPSERSMRSMVREGPGAKSDHARQYKRESRREVPRLRLSATLWTLFLAAPASLNGRKVAGCRNQNPIPGRFPGKLQFGNVIFCFLNCRE